MIGEIKNSIHLTPEGDRKVGYFNTWKDIVIPGMEYVQKFYSVPGRKKLAVEVRDNWKCLAFFRGTTHHHEGDIYSKGPHPKLEKLFEGIICEKRIEQCDPVCYHDEMRNSKFCLNPLGWMPWTWHFYQALMTCCVPMVIVDIIEFHTRTRSTIRHSSSTYHRRTSITSSRLCGACPLRSSSGDGG